MTDFVLRGGWVVDGTGAPRRGADVAVGSGRIEEVGQVGRRTGARSIDVTGLIVAPGFIDAHTHYDALILWDPDLTPSAWHGVTSVVMGNCGFGVAPTHSREREWILRPALEVTLSMSGVTRNLTNNIVHGPTCIQRLGVHHLHHT